MTPPTKNAYVCKKCGYVLPKKDAVVSGWDAALRLTFTAQDAEKS